MAQKRFHLTPEGPMPCSVDPSNPRSRGCFYGGEHYDTPDAAEDAYAEQMGGTVPSAETRAAGSPESFSAEEFEAAARHFSSANDLTAPEARALAHRLRYAPEPSGEDEMYRGMTGYGGISGVSWDELGEGSRLPMKPRSWTSDERVADGFSWDQSADEDDPSIKSVLVVAEGGIEGAWIHEHSEFDWQAEMVSTSGVFVVDSIESRDGGDVSVEDSESILISGHWETTELDDEGWHRATVPFVVDSQKD